MTTDKPLKATWSDMKASWGRSRYRLAIDRPSGGFSLEEALLRHTMSHNRDDGDALAGTPGQLFRR